VTRFDRTRLGAITERDRGLYRDFFTRERRHACYGNSWSYITQACRGLGSGVRYHDRDVLLSLGMHRDRYVVVRPLGVLDDRFIDLVKHLHEKSGRPVMVKKLYPDQAERLHELGSFREAARYEGLHPRPRSGRHPWDAKVFADDDTWPVLIVDTELTLDFDHPPREWRERLEKARVSPTEPRHLRALGRYHRDFQRQVQCFERSALRVALTPYGASTKTEVRALLREHFGPERQDDVAAYEPFRSAPGCNGADGDRWCHVARLGADGPAVGFLLAERLDLRSAGLYASVVSRRPNGLSEYVLARFIALLRAHGIDRLNVGGSEAKGLHAFKRKLGPVEERYMPMLAYGAA